MGRPSGYNPEYAKQAVKLCMLGATDEDIAGFFEVSARTIYRWKIEHEAFCQALKAGKAEADDRVERSLYHKAVGYTFDGVKVFMPAGAGKPVYAPVKEHVPPDTTACIFWLKNRRPDEWRDKTEQEHSGKITVQPIERPYSDTESLAGAELPDAAVGKPPNGHA